jgi:NitT/TauT family transport system ATP-binding protein
VVAVENVDLTIAAGEFVTIIGPSGCGKSTLLHCIGGMLAPSDGTIHHDGQRVTRPNPHHAAFVFQDASLLPWKTVLDNVSMGMRFAGEGRRGSLARAREEVAFVGLADFADSYPAQLSGGMQQRASVARALAMRPQLLLMDEPFGALDEQLRRSLGSDIAHLLNDSGQSVVMVTHSLEEAVFWGDRIVVMSPRPGRIVAELSVSEPRPRDLAFMATKEFDALRRQLFELIALERATTSKGASDG